MRLQTLEMTNFRCFAHASVTLNAAGVIGIAGPNGAGKSSVFEAVFFALYGPGAGRRISLRRDGAAPDDEPTCVKVALTYDGRFVEVMRDETTATVTVDGVLEAEGRAATTAAITRLLGLDRHQFLATFYARQSEVESFANTTERLRHIKDLLGLTHLAKAAELARTDRSAQALVVTTLAQDLVDVGEARELVTRQREAVEALAPAIATAAGRGEELAAQQADAWQTLVRAEADAERLQQARGEGRLAEARQERAVSDARQAQELAERAEEALAQVAALQPTAARLPELEASAAEFALRRQAHEQYLTHRAERADAQRRHAEAHDELAALPVPRRGSDVVQAQLTEHAERLPEARRSVSDLRERTAGAARAQALRAEVAALPELERASRQAQEALQGLRSRLDRIGSELAEGLHHAEDVRRDGPDARCVRCRRAYGDDYATILAAFEAEIEQLTAERDSLEGEVAQLDGTESERLAAMGLLRRTQGELDAMPAADEQELRQALDDAIAAAAADEQATAALREELADVKALELARSDASDRLRQIATELEVLDRRLEGEAPTPYAAEAHEETLAALAEAQEADRICRRLGTVAEGLELARRRRAAAQQALADAEAQLAATAEAVQALEAEAEPLDDARERVEALAEHRRTADAALAELKQEETRLRKDAEAAQAALAAAQREQRRLRAAQNELRIVEVTADGLADYAREAQRRALPRLETETAALLARLSGGAYGDVRLDDRAALTILDAGEHRPLERFSGGEQDLAHLCLRLALSRTFATSRGADPGLIILDEVFGSQDLQRRAALLEHLRQLEDEFDQVFVISHFDDVAAACDVQFEVQKHDGVSAISPG